jgi:hypothetical protein
LQASSDAPNNFLAPFHEIDLVEILRREPQNLLKRPVLQVSREISHHEKMKLKLSVVRIDPSLLEYPLTNFGDDVQLLRQLALQGGPWVFSIFHFAAGKFSPQLISQALLPLAD